MLAPRLDLTLIFISGTLLEVGVFIQVSFTINYNTAANIVHIFETLAVLTSLENARVAENGGVKSIRVRWSLNFGESLITIRFNYH